MYHSLFGFWEWQQKLEEYFDRNLFIFTKDLISFGIFHCSIFFSFTFGLFLFAPNILSLKWLVLKAFCISVFKKKKKERKKVKADVCLNYILIDNYSQVFCMNLIIQVNENLIWWLVFLLVLFLLFFYHYASSMK